MEIKAETLNDHTSNLTIGDQPVVIGGKYRFTLRNLTCGMMLLADEDTEARGVTLVRYALVSASDFGIEFVNETIHGTTYTVATAESVMRLPVSVFGTLAKLVMDLNHLQSLDSVAVDFTPAG